MNTIDI